MDNDEQSALRAITILGGPGTLYHKMINEIADYAILILDIEGAILNWNKGAQRIKGYSADEAIGKNFRIFYTAEDRSNQLPEQLLNTAMSEGKATHEGWRIKKDGGKFWGLVLITALHDERGNVIAFSKVTRDLTERKTAEERQRRQTRELQQKNRQLANSEAIYHSMIAEVEDYAIILLDTQGNIKKWNKGAEKIKGYKEAEIQGKNFSQFYLQDDIDSGLPQLLLSKAKHEGTATHEGWRVRKDGNIFWGLIVITALHDDKGKVIGYAKVTRDLTERKMAEERNDRYASELQYNIELLKKSEERYHRMVAEVEDYAIILLDTEGNILNWNKGAQKIKGYSENEILGKNISIFYQPEDIENNVPRRLLDEAALNNRASLEGWRVRKDGTRFWGSVVITALHNAQGEVTGYSKVTRDLTERKEAEDRILRQNRQLEEFAYVASHDLQEPLRKILTFANKLSSNETARDQSINKIVDAAGRMRELIDDVLNYSKMKNDDALFEDVDINSVLNAIQNDFELVLKEKNAKIIFENLPVIHAIPIQMHQLFSNLISNGLKYNNSAYPTIAIEATPVTINDEKYNRFSVTDNGSGFDSQYSDKIFHMFYRINKGQQGTGIGLALCKKIAENHGGFIEATSNEGNGSTFIIHLKQNL